MTNPNEKTWQDPKRVELLIKLVKEGWSGGLIAARLGISRNSVIGKVNRLGMQLGNSRNSMRQNIAARLRLKAVYQKKRAEKLKSPAPKVQFERAPIPPKRIEDVARKSFAELEPNDCRFPVGNPGSKWFGFCGLERIPGSSYCLDHHCRTHQAVPVKNRPMPVKKTEDVDA